MSYEPKIKVVRKMGANSWYLDDGRYRSDERAYLVRGLPMPGERVVDRYGTVHTVRAPEVKWVEVYDGSHRLMKVLRLKALCPYDPEAERLRVATEAVMDYWKRTDDDEAEDIARAVLDALKEVDDG